jgi:cytochrome c-type biogenesis protein CcmH/NrfG
MQENDKATHAFENVLRLNPHNVQALTQLASICTIQERYQQVQKPNAGSALTFLK